MCPEPAQCVGGAWERAKMRIALPPPRHRFTMQGGACHWHRDSATMTGRHSRNCYR